MSILRIFVVVGLLLLATGCTSEDSPRVRVRGKVMFQNRPLPFGTVVFAPDVDRGTQGPLAQADIQPDGSYDLRTGTDLGTAPGHYRVTVVAIEPAGQPPPGQAFALPRSLIPERYRDPELSGLTCEVRAGTENGFDFNLE